MTEAVTTDTTDKTVDTSTTDTATDKTVVADTTKTGADKTIVNDAGDKDNVVVMADWPADWREKLAGDDKKSIDRLKRFAAPSDLLKSYRQLEQKLSSGELKRAAAPENATPEELKAWRAEVGVPETPEGYLEKLPKDLIVGDDDKEMIDDYLKQMHAANASPDQVAANLKWYTDFHERQQTQQAENDRTFHDTSVEELRGEWGQEYRGNVNMVKNLLASAPEGVAENILAARLADGTLFGDNPNTLRWLAGLAREANPIHTVTGASGANAMKSVEEEIGKLEGMMGNKRSEYWTGPNADKNQARYRDLVAARDSGKAKGRAA